MVLFGRKIKVFQNVLISTFGTMLQIARLFIVSMIVLASLTNLPLVALKKSIYSTIIFVPLGKMVSRNLKWCTYMVY